MSGVVMTFKVGDRVITVRNYKGIDNSWGGYTATYMGVHKNDPSAGYYKFDDPAIFAFGLTENADGTCAVMNDAFEPLLLTVQDKISRVLRDKQLT